MFMLCAEGKTIPTKLEPGDRIHVDIVHGLLSMNRHGARILPNVYDHADDKVLIDAKTQSQALLVARLLASAAGCCLRIAKASNDEDLFSTLTENPEAPFGIEYEEE